MKKFLTLFIVCFLCNEMIFPMEDEKSNFDDVKKELLAIKEPDFWLYAKKNKLVISKEWLSPDEKIQIRSLSYDLLMDKARRCCRDVGSGLLSFDDFTKNLPKEDEVSCIASREFGAEPVVFRFFEVQKFLRDAVLGNIKPEEVRDSLYKCDRYFMKTDLVKNELLGVTFTGNLPREMGIAAPDKDFLRRWLELGRDLRIYGIGCVTGARVGVILKNIDSFANKLDSNDVKRKKRGSLDIFKYLIIFNQDNSFLSNFLPGEPVPCTDHSIYFSRIYANDGLNEPDIRFRDDNWFRAKCVFLNHFLLVRGAILAYAMFKVGEKCDKQDLLSQKQDVVSYLKKYYHHSVEFYCKKLRKIDCVDDFKEKIIFDENFFAGLFENYLRYRGVESYEKRLEERLDFVQEKSSLDQLFAL